MKDVIKGQYLQMIYMEMTVSWLLPYNCFVKSMVKKLGATS